MRSNKQLLELPLLAHFDELSLEKLGESGTEVRYSKGDTIFKEGDVASSLHGVIRGGVRLQKALPNGPITLGRFIRGELLGSRSYLRSEPRYADAVCETSVELIDFPRQRLAMLARVDPTFEQALYWAFWKSLSAKLREANERLAAFYQGESLAPAAEDLETPALPEPGFTVDLAEKRALFKQQKLSSLEINLLSSLSSEQRYGAGELIFREGEPGENMFAVLNGTVMITKMIPGAGNEALAFLEKGDIFGEMALIDRKPRSASAKAHDRGAQVLEISRDVLEAILDIRKISSTPLLKILCGRLAQRLSACDAKLIGWWMLTRPPE